LFSKNLESLADLCSFSVRCYGNVIASGVPITDYVKDRCNKTAVASGLLDFEMLNGELSGSTVSDNVRNGKDDNLEKPFKESFFRL
jgi:hypothetical protein